MASQTKEERVRDTIIQLDELLEDTFYYKTASGMGGIIEKDVRALYQKNDGKYYLHSLTSGFEEDAGDCELKYLLMSKQKRFNVLDSLGFKSYGEPLFPKKIQRINDGFILRLSNRHIQFMIEGSSYLYAEGQKLYEIVGHKEKEMSLGKIMNGTLVKGNKDHFKVIRQVLKELKYLKDQSCKENRPSY